MKIWKWVITTAAEYEKTERLIANIKEEAKRKSADYIRLEEEYWKLNRSYEGSVSKCDYLEAEVLSLTNENDYLQQQISDLEDTIGFLEEELQSAKDYISELE